MVFLKARIRTDYAAKTYCFSLVALNNFMRLVDVVSVGKIKTMLNVLILIS